MMFDLSMDKIVVLAVIAAFLIGPSRLPTAAAWLADAVRKLSAFTEGAKDRVREELGEDFDAVDWHKLDPRRYDPRRIISDAFLDAGVSQTIPTPSAAPELEVVEAGENALHLKSEKPYGRE